MAQTVRNIYSIFSHCFSAEQKNSVVLEMIFEVGLVFLTQEVLEFALTSGLVHLVLIFSAICCVQPSRS